MSAPTTVEAFEKPPTSPQRPRPSRLGQWWVLTLRFITPSLRNGELITAIGGPAALTAGIYIPFSTPWNHYVGGAGFASSLGQYIGPLIVLQAVGLAALSSAFRSATDSLHGVNRRFAAMPIPPLTPVLARVSASVYRCSIGLVVSIVCSLAIGFRFYHGGLNFLGFCVLVMVFGVLLSFGADLIGIATKNPDAMLPLLSVPALIFGLLSVGVLPLKLFPHWIQPLVRNQPISQLIAALRAFSGETTKADLPVTWPVMAPALLWLLGCAVVLVPVSILVLAKRS